MRRWLLPEGIEDLLPDEARHVELLRRRLLDEFECHGYQLVAPPLLEYVESLLTGSGRDLDPRTFKLVDQLSGRTMGVRADITPQVARIDAHLLNRKGVTRLCYCGSVLHTRPAGLMASREPLQIGAELYGHEGPEADSEIIRLLARTLALAAIAATRIDLGHVGIFRALIADSGLSGDAEQEVFAALQAKDLPTLADLVATIPQPARAGLLVLPELYGDAKVLDEAGRRLPATPEIGAALMTLRRLANDWRTCRSDSIWRTCAAITITTALSSPPTAMARPVRSRSAAAMTRSANRSAAAGRRQGSRSTCAIWRVGHLDRKRRAQFSRPGRKMRRCTRRSNACAAKARWLCWRCRAMREIGARRAAIGACSDAAANGLSNL